MQLCVGRVAIPRCWKLVTCQPRMWQGGGHNRPPALVFLVFLQNPRRISCAFPSFPIIAPPPSCIQPASTRHLSAPYPHYGFSKSVALGPINLSFTSCPRGQQPINCCKGDFVGLHFCLLGLRWNLKSRLRCRAPPMGCSS